MCIKSSTLGLLDFSSVASSSRMGRYFVEEEGGKRGHSFCGMNCGHS